MKKKKKKFSLKKWFYNKILNRYLIEFHPQFILFADNLSIKTDGFSFNEKRAAKEYKRIMKVLNSPRYKKFFYNSVKYELSTGPAPFKPFKDTRFEKLKKFIAKQYLRLFNKKLYQSLEVFKSLSSKFETLNTQMDNYMKNTTVSERCLRAKELGIISEEAFEADGGIYDRTNKNYHYSPATE
jgi:hypothetical protein